MWGRESWSGGAVLSAPRANSRQVRLMVVAVLCTPLRRERGGRRGESCPGVFSGEGHLTPPHWPVLGPFLAVACSFHLCFVPGAEKLKTICDSRFLCYVTCRLTESL